LTPGAGEQLKNEVVRVRNLGCGVSVGSGLVIDPHEFVTNSHVIEGSGNIQVNLRNGTLLTSRVVVASARRDLAIVRVDGDLPLPAPSFGPVVSAVTRVTVAGFPLAEAYSTTPGRILGPTTLFGFPSYTLDAPIVPGDSGGPVLDSEGRVVAIVNAKNLRAHRAYAIPIGEVARLRSGAIPGTSAVPCGESDRIIEELGPSAFP
jgi:S1-C subfamily serine protease